MIYSQNDEQQVIEAFFEGRHGRFLDIGAYDGITFSNTRRLLELGWFGVVVEPSPRNLVKLLKAMEPFASRCVVIASAVGSGNRMAQLYVDDTVERGWAATIAPEGRVSVLNANPMCLMVSVIDVNTVMEYGPYQFLSLDAEWMDFEILESMDPRWLEPLELICAEPSDHKARERMKAWFQERGFTLHHETPENLMVKR